MQPRPRVVAALVLLLAALAGCGGADVGAPSDVVAGATAPPAAAEVPAGTWEKVARSPLSPRNNSVVAWTGKEVLVFGGETFVCAGPLRGAMSCAAPEDPALRDGAAYDLAHDRWRRIAKAPVPMTYASTVVQGDTMFVLQYKDFFAYDLAQDRWRRLPAPPEQYARLVEVGDLLVAYRGSSKEGGRDRYWDAAGERWAALPPTPGRAVFEREMVDAGGVGVLVGRPQDAKGDYSRAGLAAVSLDPKTRRWTALSYAKGRDAAALVSYAPQPLHVAGGKVASASFFGDRLPYGKDGPLIGGILDLDAGWSRLPARPVQADQRARDEAIADLPGPAYNPEDPRLPYVEHFAWLNVGGDGFVVAGAWALDVARGTWQLVPTDAGPLGLYSAAAVWAGDRVFAWGGSGGFRENVATGWTWRPTR